MTPGPHRCSKTSGTCVRPGGAVFLPINGGKQTGNTRGNNAQAFRRHHTWPRYQTLHPDGHHRCQPNHGLLLGRGMATTGTKLLVRRLHHPQPPASLDRWRGHLCCRPGTGRLMASAVLVTTRPNPAITIYRRRYQWYQRNARCTQSPRSKIAGTQPRHRVLDRPADTDFPHHVPRRVLLPSPRATAPRRSRPLRRWHLGGTRLVHDRSRYTMCPIAITLRPGLSAYLTPGLAPYRWRPRMGNSVLPATVFSPDGHVHVGGTAVSTPIWGPERLGPMDRYYQPIIWPLHDRRHPQRHADAGTFTDRPVLPQRRISTTGYPVGLYPVGRFHRYQTTDRAGVTLRRAIVGVAARSTYWVSCPGESLGRFLAHRWSGIDDLRRRHRPVVWLDSSDDDLRAGRLSLRPLWPVGTWYRLDR